MRLPVTQALTIVIAICASISCVSQHGLRYASWAARPTPGVFVLESPWAFVELNKAGEIVRSMTITFTDKPAESCIGGEWRQVMASGTAPAQLPDVIGQPAYALQGSALWINFTANICDSEDAFIGELSDLGFVGRARTSGLGGDTYHGRVHGERA